MATFARCTRLLSSNSSKLALRKLYSYKPPIQNMRQFSRYSILQADRLYSEKHEWITVENSVGTVGISAYAQEKLGDIVYAQLPEEGAEFDQDDECGALESVKAASELYIPVSGKITVSNMEVVDKTSLINSSPYDEGWLFKVELSKPEELDSLMDEDAYQKFLETEE